MTQHHHAVASFDRIVVIFNPQSTDGPPLAEELHTDLTTRCPRSRYPCVPPNSPATCDIAREIAQTGHPLIVSVSGDGGYNEVVDGVMQAGNNHATCAVKAAGNANDHRRTTGRRPIVDAITAGEVRRIDLLCLAIGDGVGTRTQYAHSYIGCGCREPRHGLSSAHLLPADPVVTVRSQRSTIASCGLPTHLSAARPCAELAGTARPIRCS